MNHTQALKHQWQSSIKPTHRVRFFTTPIDFLEVAYISKTEKFNQVVELFKKQPQFNWVAENDVKLHWMEDDQYVAWHKTVTIYGDLTESQYVDYALRFFKHGRDWK